MLISDTVIMHEAMNRDAQPLPRQFWQCSHIHYRCCFLVRPEARDLRCKDQPKSKTRSEGHLSLKVCTEHDAVADAVADSSASFYGDDLLLEVR
jgi:hypothetical protein